MPKQIGSLAPATVSVALVAIILATAPAQAAADCVPAPGLQAAQGSHWYYRTDHATGRKCWYVSSEGRKGHGQIAPNLTTRAQDRKSTRLNSSHLVISYAVFCLKK